MFNARSIANHVEAMNRAEQLRPILTELASLSARAIATTLNERKIATPSGGKWHAATVIRVRDRMVIHHAMKLTGKDKKGERDEIKLKRLERMVEDIGALITSINNLLKSQAPKKRGNPNYWPTIKGDTAHVQDHRRPACCDDQVVW